MLMEARFGLPNLNANTAQNIEPVSPNRHPTVRSNAVPLPLRVICIWWFCSRFLNSSQIWMKRYAGHSAAQFVQSMKALYTSIHSIPLNYSNYMTLDYITSVAPSQNLKIKYIVGISCCKHLGITHQNSVCGAWHSGECNYVNRNNWAVFTN